MHASLLKTHIFVELTYLEPTPAEELKHPPPPHPPLYSWEIVVVLLFFCLLFFFFHAFMYHMSSLYSPLSYLVYERLAQSLPTTVQQVRLRHCFSVGPVGLPLLRGRPGRSLLTNLALPPRLRAGVSVRNVEIVSEAVQPLYYVNVLLFEKR